MLSSGMPVTTSHAVPLEAAICCGVCDHTNLFVSSATISAHVIYTLSAQGEFIST